MFIFFGFPLYQNTIPKVINLIMKKSDTYYQSNSNSLSQENVQQLSQQISNSILLKSNTINKNEFSNIKSPGALSKQILDYYNLFGQNRDLEQYLRLPISSQTNENACNHHFVPHGNINCSKSITQVENNTVMNLPTSSEESVADLNAVKLASQVEESAEPESQSHNSEIKCHKERKKWNKPSNIESKKLTVLSAPENASFTAKIEQLQKLNKNTSKNKSKHREVSFNVESQIEINFSNTTNSKSSVKSEELSKSPNPEAENVNVLKLEESIEPIIKPQKNSNLSPNLDVSIPAVSPTSSITSNKKLEWDSLGDVGYPNPSKILTERPLSTIERIALKRGLQDYRSEIDNVLTAFENMDIEKLENMKPHTAKRQLNSQNLTKDNIGAESTTFQGQCLGTPNAESTPIVKETENQKKSENVFQNVIAESATFRTESLGVPNAESTPVVKESEIKISDECAELVENVKANEKVRTENIDDEKENLFKSNETVDTIINVAVHKVEKYVQTSLPKTNYVQKNTSNASEKFIHLTDKRKSSSKRSINIRKKSPLKQKYDVNIKKLICDEKTKTKNESNDFLYKKCGRYKDSLDSLSTDRVVDCNDSQYTNADSFEYLPGNEYDKREISDLDFKDKEVNLITTSNSISEIKGVRKEGILRRSEKMSDISKLVDSKIVSSQTCQSLDKGKEIDQCTTSSRRSSTSKIFDDPHSSTLQRDLKTGLHLFSALASNKSGNLDDRKRLVRKVVKRLIEANYPEDSSVDTSDNSRKKRVSDNASSSCSLGTNTSLNPSSSTATSSEGNVVKHLSANVPWTPAGNNMKHTKSRQNSIINGVDFIRGQIPAQHNENKSIDNKVKTVHSSTSSSKNMSQSSVNSTKSHTSSNPSLRDWLEPFTKSEKTHDRGVLSNMQEDDIRKKQEELTTNLIKRQQRLFKRNSDMINKFEKRSVTPDSGLLHYAQKEKEHQLSWINNEIEHLYHLKKLLESQKFDDVSSKYSRSDRTGKSHTSPKKSLPVHYESVVYTIEQARISGVDSTDSSVTRNIKTNIAETNSYNVHNTTLMSSDAKSSQLHTSCSECSHVQKSDSQTPIEERHSEDQKLCETSTENNVQDIIDGNENIPENKSESYKIKRKILDEHGSRRCSQCYCKRMDKQKSSGSISAASGERTLKHPSNKSLDEQMKTLAHDIEALKRSVQLCKNKNKYKKDTHQMSFAAWDSHVNSSRKYTSVEHIKSRKYRTDNCKNVESSTPVSILKPSSTDDSINIPIVHKNKPEVDYLNKQAKSNICPVIGECNKLDGNVNTTNHLYISPPYEKVDVSSQTSDTHPSLKSVTLSDKTDDKSASKTPTPTGESFSIHSSWEIYLDKNTELAKTNKPKYRKLEADSKQEKDIIAKKSSSECNFNNEEHVNKVCTCYPKKVMRNTTAQTDSGVRVKSKSKKKSYPQAVAYLLTFETISNGNESMESTRKHSLEEIKIKVPVPSRTKKAKKESALLNKPSTQMEHTRLSQKSKGSHSAEMIVSNALEVNDKIIPEPAISSASFESENSNTNENDINSDVQATNKNKKNSLQEFLKINRPAFVRSAETRRKTIQEISELRKKRNSERKRLLTVLDSDRAEGNADLDEFKKKQGIIMPPVPMTQKRVFTSQEIRKMTFKKYKNLPEVTQKKENKKRENIYRNNRLIAEIFNKKLQRRVLRGQLTLSNSFTVVTELD